MKPPPLPEMSRASGQSSWNNVGYSIVAVLSASVAMAGILIAKARGPSTFISFFGIALLLASVGVCLWFFIRCPRRPLTPKLVCLVLCCYILYYAVDSIANRAF